MPLLLPHHLQSCLGGSEENRALSFISGQFTAAGWSWLWSQAFKIAALRQLGCHLNTLLPVVLKLGGSQMQGELVPKYEATHSFPKS